MTPQEFCIAQSVRFARTLSYQDCLEYLHGLLLVAGDRPEVDELRAAFNGLTESDAQLELIAGNQLKLNLTEEAR